MKSLLAVVSLATGVGIALFIPEHGAGAVALCAVLALVVGLIITRGQTDRNFLIQIFVAGLLVRVLCGAAIYTLGMHEFFGGDAFTYDELGFTLTEIWRGEIHPSMYGAIMGPFMARNWGMLYVVATIYTVVGRNMLAVQFFSAVLGATTAPVIYHCALSIFRNMRVARLSACFVAFFPSLVLWSSQGLKDGPLVFLLALAMLATLKLAEKLSIKYMLVVVPALFGIMTLRFYVFYMMAAAIAGAFIVGRRPLTVSNVARQVIMIVALGLSMTYLGVLRSASTQFETFGNLEMLQRSRADQVVRADSGFGKDVDVSTTAGALSTIPLGMLHLLFAPFPWQLASLRQSITLPEMLVWWAAFPLVVIGAWFTLKYRMREAMPILIFTVMLTLAYSVFQGNVGTAYRQRSQLLIFYFIFASVGLILVRERRENRLRQIDNAGGRASAARPAYARVHPYGHAPLGEAGAATARRGDEVEDVAAAAASARGGGEMWAGARKG